MTRTDVRILNIAVGVVACSSGALLGISAALGWSMYAVGFAVPAVIVGGVFGMLSGAVVDSLCDRYRVPSLLWMHGLWSALYGFTCWWLASLNAAV